MGPRIPASQPALAGVGCGARGGRRRKDECPAYHGSSYRGPSRLARTLATTASRAESLNLPVRVSLHRTAARGGAGIMSAPSQPLAVRRDTGRRESNLGTEIAAARWGWQICPAQHSLRSRAGIRWPRQPPNLSPCRVEIMRIFMS